MKIKKIKKVLQYPKRIGLYLFEKKVFNVLPDKTFLKLRYRVAYSKKLNLKNPKGFNEKLPKNFEKMVEIAEKLLYGLTHVRVDLYNIEGAIFL